MATATQQRDFTSPYRMIGLLEDIHAVLGNRRIVLCRELTKKFEEIVRGDVEKVIQDWKNKKILGELTLVVEGTKNRSLG